MAGAGNAEDGRRQDSGRKAVIGALTAALIIGLVGVFFALPRWQEQRTSNAEATHDTGPPASAAQLPAIEPPATAIIEIQTIPPDPPAVATKVSTRSASAPIAPPPTRGPSKVDRDFASAMSEGLQAIDQERWAAAQTALDRAARLKPKAPEVADALTQLRAQQRRTAISSGIRHARDLEDGERWQEATDAYSVVLGADPESAAALDGHDRASQRAALDKKLEYHLHNPSRLTTPSVLEDATALLEEARGVEPGGPRLAAQTSRLGALIELASEPLEVTLESDSLTDVTVYQVGRLGAFATHQLKLRPGAYTAVGSRAGYRDVRVRFAVMPGTPIKPIVIRCTESL